MQNSNGLCVRMSIDKILAAKGRDSILQEQP